MTLTDVPAKRVLPEIWAAGTSPSAEVDVAAADGEVPAAQISGNTRFAGTSVSVITPPVAQEMNLPFDSKGIVVTDVAAGSPADRMGLQKGDVIVSINGEELADVQRFETLVGTQGRGWQIVLQRNGQVIQSFISG